MGTFKDYLQQQRFKASTIEEHLNNVKRFISWFNTDGSIEIKEVQYNDLLAYIQQEKGKRIDPATINLRLSSISHYFEFLKQSGEIFKNPAKTLRVKGAVSKVVQNPLNPSELENLYQQYSQLKKVAHRQKQVELVHARNTVIVGLLVFQGVHSGELQKMEINHIDLDAGTVYIPSTSQSNYRALELSSKQIIYLHQYVGTTRSHFKPKGEELFTGSIRNIIVTLVQEIQGLNPLVTNALHLRGSVILNWLKIYPKRQVQYMAGHKYISSTEKYASQDMEGLQDALSKHHPFG